MKNSICILLVLVSVHGLPVPVWSQSQESQQTQQSVTAILGAFDAEIKLLQSKVTAPKEHQVMGVKFVSGQLNGRQVVIAQTGIGKVNAAMTTTLAIHQFKPRAIIFTGIAGGVNPLLQPGDIVIAEKTAQHDYGAVVDRTFESRPTRNPVNYADNPVFFPADPELLRMAEAAVTQTTFESPAAHVSRIPIVMKGVVVTGDVFVSSAQKKRKLRKDFGADATEMEGAAVAQICGQQRVPCLVIRSMSDTAGKDARKSMRTFYEITSRNSANLVMSILEQQEK